MSGLQPCKHPEDIQPVGGRVQDKWRKQQAEIAAAKKAAEAEAAACRGEPRPGGATFAHAQMAPTFAADYVPKVDWRNYNYRTADQPPAGMYSTYTPMAS